MKGIDPSTQREGVEHQIDDLSYEVGHRNTGEIEARIEEIKRIIRMMKVENTIDYSEGFFRFMQIREIALQKRIDELKKELEAFK